MENINCYKNIHSQLLTVLGAEPQAYAYVKGSPDYPDIHGDVRFYQTANGVVVYAIITGLPDKNNRFFGFHIHSGSTCTGNSGDAFADAKGHYNPSGSLHPHHAGDLPVLISNNGCALTIFLTDSFSVREIVGKTVIIHNKPDDFRTQPAGESGIKIACGEIKSM